MKITSINFIKAADVPKVTRNTDNMAIAQELKTSLDKAPAGHSVTFKLDKSKKYTRYSIQRACAAMNLSVKISAQGENFYAVKQEKPATKK